MRFAGPSGTGPTRQRSDSAKERLALLASTWDVLWPQNRRRALADVFETMTWRSRTNRLLVRLRVAASHPGTDETATG